MLVSFKARGAKIAIRRGFRERKAPHRCWPERLRDRATDRHSAPHSLGLAAPATGPSEIVVPVKMHRCRLLWLARASVQLSARPLSGRRLRLTTSPSWRLRVILDKKYPGIIDRCRMAIDSLFPGQQASVQQQPKGCVVVSHYSKHWPCLLPQHGPGRKHLRRIRLEPWQEVLVKEATEEFVRGLIDSDGCRVVANDRGVKSVRYHFSNRSEDIRALFCAALDDLGIPWTQPRWFEVAVYRKAAVARLDEFVGPKA
jgi:hypothetical protein